MGLVLGLLFTNFRINYNRDHNLVLHKKNYTIQYLGKKI